MSRISYRTTYVPNDMRALSLRCDYDTHMWVQDERETKVTITSAVFVRFVCKIKSSIH